MWPFRRRRGFQVISEAEAYERSYGLRTADVHVVKREAAPPPRRPRYDVLLRGERIRRAFSDRLDARQRHES